MSSWVTKWKSSKDSSLLGASFGESSLFRKTRRLRSLGLGAFEVRCRKEPRRPRASLEGAELREDVATETSSRYELAKNRARVQRRRFVQCKGRKGKACPDHEAGRLEEHYLPKLALAYIIDHRQPRYHYHIYSYKTKHTIELHSEIQKIGLRIGIGLRTIPFISQTPYETGNWR